MSSRELRAKLRETENILKASRDRVREKEEKINKLSDKLILDQLRLLGERRHTPAS
ncbi:MAG: hypothetical protein ACTXOO_00590 [Sodalis sp. (in: enterobacteria)]